VYQLFEIVLKNNGGVNLEGLSSKLKNMGWYLDGCSVLVKEDDGLQYVLDLSAFKLKCIISELFPIDEGKWSPEAFPSREALVNSAIAQLRKLPLNLEIKEVRRIITRG
jgi:hypothetical protein